MHVHYEHGIFIASEASKASEYRLFIQRYVCMKIFSWVSLASNNDGDFDLQLLIPSSNPLNLLKYKRDIAMLRSNTTGGMSHLYNTYKL